MRKAIFTTCSFLTALITSQSQANGPINFPIPEEPTELIVCDIDEFGLRVNCRYEKIKKDKPIVLPSK